jgi:serine/threonine-protein kinase
VDDPLAHLLDAGLDISQERRYVVERELGRGSMGVVYAGRDQRLERPVALKVMAGAMSGDGDLRRYFEREARAAGRLSHRNVVTVHDFGYDRRGAPFVVMELLRGRDLRQILLSMVPMALERRLAIVLQVLAGLAHAHAAGVVHRDVKPANVFITEEGVVKLLDFGIARLTQTSHGNSSDAVMGTADYMSPEQVLSGDMDGRSDLFSCGALLYELLTGGPPFHAESFVTIAYRVVHEEPDYSVLPAACRSLEPVLRRALAKSRDDRFPSAPDFATEIGLAMGVGVAPETIQPAPAWTVPLPRLVPPRDPSPTMTLRARREDGALRPPDHSPVTPRWPLQLPPDEDEAPPARPARRGAGRLGAAALGACAAVAAFTVGVARWNSVATPPSEPATLMAPADPGPAAAAMVAEVAATPAPEVVTPSPLDPPSGLGQPLAVPAAVDSAPPPPAPERRPLPAARGSLWNTAPTATAAAGAVLSAPAPEPSVPPAPEPRPRVVKGRWTGYVTDDMCRNRGAVNDHGQCLEVCLRRGAQALIAIDGQLYKLVGLARIDGLNDRRVVVEGELDHERRTLTVASGAPAR